MSKDFDVGVTRGYDVKDIMTIASTRCNSHSLILLFAFAQQVTSRPDIRGRLVVLWFST